MVVERDAVSKPSQHLAVSHWTAVADTEPSASPREPSFPGALPQRAPCTHLSPAWKILLGRLRGVLSLFRSS